MRILLDENMPRKLLAALVAEGHEVDSVKSLQLEGIDNGALYQFALSNYPGERSEFDRDTLAKTAVDRVAGIVDRKLEPIRDEQCS